MQRIRTLDWIDYRDTPDGYQDDTALAISAWVTSAGRLHLWEALQHVWPDAVYYCDTDSVMVDHDGEYILRNAGLLRVAEWGKWYRKESSTDVDICGPKTYRFGDRIVSAGVARNPDCDYPTWPVRSRCTRPGHEGRQGEGTQKGGDI